MLFDEDILAKEFITNKLMDIDIDFFRYDGLDCTTADFIEDTYYSYKQKLGATWIKSGASKVVLYFEDEFPDIVFKIPFYGSICGDFNCDVGEFILDFDSVSMFNYADIIISSYSGWDYCSVESRLYEESVYNNVSDFFAETRFLCDYNDEDPIYISEYIESTGVWGVRSSKDSLNKVKKLRKDNPNFEILSPQVFGKLIDEYGEENVVNLVSFIDEWGIDDLHEENIGIDGNGKLRFIDYSGFRE